MTASPSPLPPIERDTTVPWPPEEAFSRFTARFGTWWPVLTHSIGGARVKRVVFECRQGGRIYEEFKDGQRFQWGTVTAWDPPHSVGFTWHPSKDAAVAQNVVVAFKPSASGTRVVLTSSGWERLGAKAARARKGYAIGWGSVLDGFAGRRTAAIVVFAMISHTITFFLRVTGRLEREIAKSGGRMPPAATGDNFSDG